MLSTDNQLRIEKLLTTGGLVSANKLKELKLEAIQRGESLLVRLQETKLVDDEMLTKLLAQTYEVPYVNLASYTISPEILNRLPRDVADNYKSVVFGKIQGKLAIAMIDPTNVQAIDFLSRKIGEPITTYMASEPSIERILEQYPNNIAADVSAEISRTQAPTDTPKQVEEKLSAQNVQNLVQDAPITRALNTIIDYAVASRASDIHIEPREADLKIRYRIDGILQETMTLPKSVESAMISRIKILSNLKIDEHRIPQDGQFQVNSGGKSVDLRIAISPVVYGEQAVIRLLDKTSTLLTLDALGFRGRAFRIIKEGIHRPHGMTLSTGPTGSGKSTTLYAIIQEIANVAINIVTLEDPVEYKMSGINQIQVNADVGLTFANGLRSILRQDPNVVMVGEIRDKETADLAVQAALTGHVVLSTLHTNSASGVLPRLLDMGVEPFLISSTVNTVIGQRLVRKICDKCTEAFESSDVQAQAIKKTLGGLLPKTKADLPKVSEDLGFDDLPLADQNAYTLHRGKGCTECTNGYKGRVGICEVFQMTPEMEHLLSEHATTTQIQDQAQKDGMITMQQDGYLKVLSGITTMEEVARVASDY